VLGHLDRIPKTLKLAQNHVHWRILELELLNIRGLLPGPVGYTGPRPRRTIGFGTGDVEYWSSTTKDELKCVSITSCGGISTVQCRAELLMAT
jgi:hypothetical protein